MQGDRTAPRLLSLSPADDATTVPADAPLGMRFIDYRGLNDPMIFVKITANRPDGTGFIETDALVLADDRMIGSFNRIDDGLDGLVDHHVIFCLSNPNAGMHHCSFEVVDPNDIFIGHDHLTKAGYEHVRGIGRHALGSQIFDYWVSPYDQMHELWSSNERFNAQSAFGLVPIGPGLAHDTGPPPSQRFVKQSTPAPGAA